ncbi:peptidase [Methanocella arvoryzae]|uniref:Peptidase n=1 Tax=Methanocella arvoryzae (strain DSM 22066 / NBRC 105507 / MRE50) TaxID=351160 RepID=Q0W2V9_METAR|nr:peptidase [Methanocella arvoryzae]CAJ37284.1 conserved hypothetical protein [Methanocella arvoryzae MRE50]
MDVDLFYVPGCEQFKDLVSRKIAATYGVQVKDRGLLPVYDRAYNPLRRQYDAYVLLDYLIRCIVSDTAVWIVDRDMYCENLNFVFGLAMYHIAAVVSTYRVPSAEMVAKEAVHEAGHVMGLQHCKNRCVMRYSESLEDALDKPSELCTSCKKTIDRKVVEPGLQM